MGLGVALLRRISSGTVGRFLFGNPLGNYQTGESRRVNVFRNPEFEPSAFTRLCDSTGFFGTPAKLTSYAGLFIAGKLFGPKVMSLTDYLRKIHTNGDMDRLKYQWNIVKGDFTKRLYRGLAEGRTDFYSGFDEVKNAVVAKFNPQIDTKKYTPRDVVMFLRTVTNFISTSIEQIDKYYPWGLGHTLARHMALGSRHADRNVVREYFEVIRQSIVIALKEEYKERSTEDSWQEGTDDKLWSDLIDHVWGSMTLDIPDLYVGHKESSV